MGHEIPIAFDQGTGEVRSESDKWIIVRNVLSDVPEINPTVVF